MNVRTVLHELKRRRVGRVAGVYAVAGWAVMEFATTVFPLLTVFPEWAPTFVVVLTLIGFPVALVLAWVFDLTDHGLERTPDSVPVPVGPAAVAMPRTPRGIARATGFLGIGILVAFVSFAAYARYSEVPPGANGAIEAIAVLPFSDLSAAGDQAYFSDGITEELLSRLAQVEGLHVAARTSSFAFKGRNENVRDIGNRLGVQAVLEGSVRREGDRFRIFAQLTDARTGFTIWTETYEREMQSIFAVQDEISAAIVSQLQLHLATSELGENTGTENVQAHDQYLLGLARLHGRSEEDLAAALGHFEAAVAADSMYALAWAGLAQVHAVRPAVGEANVEEALAAGAAAAARALSINASIAEAHAALGQIAQNFDWDLRGAEDAYRRAVEFKPSYATGHQWYAETLLAQGRVQEARREIDRALELDPLSPAALAVKALVQTAAEDLPGARATYQTLTARHPAFRLGRLHFALFAVYDGDVAGARAAIAGLDMPALEQIFDALEQPSKRAAVAAGLKARATAELTSMDALWLAALGEPDAAAQVLETIFERGGDANLPLVLTHPLLASIREDGRVRSIRRELGVRSVS